MIFDLFFTISLLLLLLGVLVSVLWLYQHQRRRYLIKINRAGKIIMSLFLFVSAAAAVIVPYLSITPKIESSYPVTETRWDDYSKPFEVKFNIPVDVRKLGVSISPELKGEWKWEPYLGISRLTKSGKFFPQENLFPKQRVVVYISGISRVGRIVESHEYGFVFDTPTLPEFTQTSPADQEINVLPDKNIELTLNKTNGNYADWTFAFNPEVQFTQESRGDNVVVLKPTSLLSQSTEYTLSVTRKPKRINLRTNEVLEYDVSEIIQLIRFNTVKEPLISQFTPKGNGVLSDSKIKVRFEEEMNQGLVEENFLIDPQTEGELVWDNSKTLSFIPLNPLPKETKFRITFFKAIQSLMGMSPQNDIFFEFETIGAVGIKSTLPQNSDVKVSEKTQIKVAFNQEVKKDSAVSNFRISPEIEGKYEWDQNTLIFSPLSNLMFDTTYTITIQKGVKSVYGADSKEDYSFSFKTRNNEVLIANMPIYFQPQVPPSFSCNIYSAKMALSWKGFNLEIPSIIAEMGYDTSQDSQGRWLGNPQDKFIGNADGSWGYGVYWKPVQRLFTSRGVQTEIKENWNVVELAKSIEAGRPAVIWRYNGTSSDRNLQWGTPGVYAINGQHGGVVTGFKGDSNNPSHFYINDPWFGLIWMDVNTFNYYWGRLNRPALVIY
jgi:uncharacterized protein YvpB